MQTYMSSKCQLSMLLCCCCLGSSLLRTESPNDLDSVRTDEIELEFRKAMVNQGRNL